MGGTNGVVTDPGRILTALSTARDLMGGRLVGLASRLFRERVGTRDRQCLLALHANY